MAMALKDKPYSILHIHTCRKDVGFHDSNTVIHIITLSQFYIFFSCSSEIFHYLVIVLFSIPMEVYVFAPLKTPTFNGLNEFHSIRNINYERVAYDFFFLHSICAPFTIQMKSVSFN